MNDTMSPFQKGMAGFFSLAGVGVAVIIILGMARCIEYERWRERTCLNEGGGLVWSGIGPSCMKIEMTPIPVPGKP